MEQSKTAVVKSCGTLKEQPQLADFQKYVTALEEERGFATQTTIDKCLLLGEEVGELFKAVRKSEGLLVDSIPISPKLQMNWQIFSFICVPLPTERIDLEAAFRSKEEKNKRRKWVRV